MIGEPLSVDGAVHDNVALPSPGVAATPVGADGAPTLTVADQVACPLPTWLTAATLNRTVEPEGSPVIERVVVVVSNVIADCGTPSTSGVTR